MLDEARSRQLAVERRAVDNQRRAALKREHGRGARVQALENMR